MPESSHKDVELAYVLYIGEDSNVTVGVPNPDRLWPCFVRN